MTTPLPLPPRLVAELLGSAFLAAFVIAHAIGDALATLAIRALYPDITPAEAADVLLPRNDTDDASVDHLASVAGDRAPR